MNKRSPKEQAEWAMYIARLWREGKEIYANSDEIRETLLGELERAHEALQKIVEGRDSLTQSNIAWEALNPNTPITGYRSRGMEYLIAAQTAADAERFRWGVEHARWIRHEHEAYVAIPVALEADLSCKAMRVDAIDKARKASATSGNPRIVSPRYANDGVYFCGSSEGPET